MRQSLLWYRDEKLLIPALSRASGQRKVIWIEPVYPRIFGLLTNPTYAGVFVSGVFVWGRNQTRTSIVDGRARKDTRSGWNKVRSNRHRRYRSHRRDAGRLSLSDCRIN